MMRFRSSPSRGTSLFHRVWRRTDGNVSVFFALLAMPMIGAIGLGVDITRAINMKAALQADVDTAAISGAAAAFGPAARIGAPGNSPAAVGQSFYRDAGLPPFNSLTASAQALKVTGAAPGTVTVKATATAQIQPAFLLYLASLVPVSATATAVASSPSAASGLFPFAIPQCTFDDNWNAATGQPNLGSNGRPLPVTLDGSNQSTTKNTNCAFGQWSSLTVGGNSASEVDGFVTGGCTCTVAVGDQVDIQPGTRASLYHAVQAEVDAATAAGLPGVTVLMAVVQGPGLTTNAESKVVGFAPFLITGTTNQSMSGNFVANFHAPGTSLGSSSSVPAPNFGAVTVALTQ
jgi:hypothetical protein